MSGEFITTSYSIDANGVGAITFTGAPASNQVIMISRSKFVFFANGNNHPVMFVLEK
ncbi:MAG TPA: hypothetical protein VJN21_11885 [Candidatus Acidoferrales bacterium]|nr:hypothetical protein [Candidatus Acidoferrales bacterium]